MLNHRPGETIGSGGCLNVPSRTGVRRVLASNHKGKLLLISQITIRPLNTIVESASPPKKTSGRNELLEYSPGLVRSPFHRASCGYAKIVFRPALGAFGFDFEPPLYASCSQSFDWCLRLEPRHFRSPCDVSRASSWNHLCLRRTQVACVSRGGVIELF